MNLLDIKSVGDKTIKLLSNLNINTVENLLEYYPYKYNFIKLLELDNVDESINSYIKGEIVSEARVSFIKKNFNRLSFKVLIDNNVINVTIFNRPFYKTNIVIGKSIVLYGKYNRLKNTFLAADIKFSIENNTIEPIYRLTDGLKKNNLYKIINNALDLDININDKVPEYLNNSYNFISKKEAINIIHNPKDINDIKKARLKLIYEELFEFMFKINYLKIKKQKDIGLQKDINTKDEDKFLNNLKFKPTIDQLKTFDEIKKDMTSKKKMNRLVLGDVGSGKTLVATYAIYLNYISGYQSAFMAPTEILASQHYNKLSSELDMNIRLITGKTTKKEKSILYEEIKNGVVDLVIGTHSLINSDLSFKNLGLVITDEQHRFGVMQRKNLEDKGNNPDVLYLSATPIPRSYALTLYGDLDVSVIKTKPHGRKDILTKVYKEEDIKEVLITMYKELKSSHQIFVVSPLIEENEESNLNSVNTLKEKLLKAFKDEYSIEIIHGGMKQFEKDKIMNKFISKEINILISTTVIEVGIDIPNATVMTIFNAERFGLATLHQLRGRVGRNDFDSYCYLISDYDNKRLKVMEESSDGFYITEKDFEERKEGDLFGTKQSGDMVFKIADIKKDYQILLQAQKDSEEYIKSKKYLDNNIYQNIINSLEM